MAFFTPEEIQRARKIDLLTYLRTYEPQELIQVSADTYCTREHDSLKISNGMWHWFSRGIGGKTALDYLIRVKEYTLPQAMEAILGRAVELPPSFYTPPKRNEQPRLLLPERAANNRNVARYLQRRGIHPAVLNWCFRSGCLYEGLPYHNAVFVGFDESGTPRYGNVRSTSGSFKGDASGSNKHYSFRIPGKSSEHVHVFEAAIDLLSFATLEHMAGRDWRVSPLLSLAGVYQSKRENVVPVALQQFLSVTPGIKHIHLHLDNDAVGRGAAAGIKAALEDKYTILDEPPACGKDMNDYLQIQLHRRKEWER